MKRKILLILSVSVFLFAGLVGLKVNAAANNYEGSILLDVERHGEAYYIFQGKKYYLGRSSQALEIMKKLSLGISENNFRTGFKQVNDISKIYRIINQKLYPYVSGRIVIRPQAHGEAYYVFPGLAAGNGYSAEYLGRPFDAFQIMTKYGVGATSIIIDAIPIGTI